MVWDSTRSQVFLFGGSTVPTNDQWVFANEDWVRQTPAVVPPVRSNHALAYDAARDRVVLFGGIGFTGNLDDTWERDATGWTQRQPAHRPSRRNGPGFVFAPTLQRTVLFGGDDQGTLAGDTWEWNGTDWLLRAPAHAPSPRRGPAMAWDEARQRVLLFGGRPGGPAPDDAMWEWDGADWTELLPAVRPSPRQDHAMACDPVRQCVLLCGGSSATAILGDTWEWDGAQWQQLAPATAPGARAGHRIIFDVGNRRALLFGGSFTFLTAFDQTWSLETAPFPARADAFGQGCAGTLATPRLAATSLPWINDNYELVGRDLRPGLPCFLLFGFSDTAYWLLPLPAELSSFLMPGCVLYTDIVEWQLRLAAADGTAHWNLTVPVSPDLRGIRVLQQALAHDPGANARGFVLSNAVASQLGAR